MACVCREMISLGCYKLWGRDPGTNSAFPPHELVDSMPLHLVQESEELNVSKQFGFSLTNVFLLILFIFCFAFIFETGPCCVAGAVLEFLRFS